MSFTFKPYRDACFQRACHHRAVARCLGMLAAIALWFRYLLVVRSANALLEALCVTAILGLLVLDQQAAYREHRQAEEDPDRVLRPVRRRVLPWRKGCP